MSQKKPTTNQQLEEMREMIANLAPGKVVSVDRELQARATTLMLMLYGATAKYGIGMVRENGVLVTAQVPVLQIPANQSLEWEVSEDGKSVMMYIVLDEDAPAEDSPSPVADTEAFGPLVGIASEPVGAVDDSAAIGDEFEDEMEVGLGNRD